MRSESILLSCRVPAACRCVVGTIILLFSVLTLLIGVIMGTLLKVLTVKGMNMNKVEIMENIVSIQWMHEKVMSIGNEYAEELWFMDYPDGADYDDIKEMAKDSQIMEWLRETFSKIWKLHLAGKL